MTTEAWSTRIRHDSDAVFREWGSELAAKMALVGLVQTADTGQIDWLTVVRAAVSTTAGYEIWRFNDSLQGTAPIFMRVDYGTGTNANAPRIQITVGTGSDGAGTITGTALTIARSMSLGNAAQTSDTLRTSYMCATEGFFGFNWKIGAGGQAEGYFFVCRSVDATGAPTATAALVIWMRVTISIDSQALRFAAPAAAFTTKTTAVTAQICPWPQTPSASLVGTDPQAAVAFTITPRVEPLVGICGVLNTEFPTGNTFQSTQVGTTPRTYIALSAQLTLFDANAQLKPAMLWE